ncbi:Wall-associated receptor kinase-like [Thalictrum thalictroides]|uniref:Wall-associated receptor kinase-like n=1 Tax=Thalictrum thalictroides TaxID=46969 RepID=A0A7J6W3W4_THATH|nr:Wall-associated receptor kinase-like [Thalictrum thalictroides]KAF5191222.1 Wall-associated receptor kinase-like [Thalictrum thalictroides]KAF5191778.1 Wall-associated receptor kinase-like [Thalictrum thalictroides]
MCIRVTCKQCGKYSWSGCGKHLASLYANIEEGKHCMCKSWPGVNMINQQTNPSASTNETPKADEATIVA